MSTGESNDIAPTFFFFIENFKIIIKTLNKLINGK